MRVDFQNGATSPPSWASTRFDLAGGAVIDDFDGDGLLDLVSSTSDPCEPMKAFRNDGEGGFEDVEGLGSRRPARRPQPGPRRLRQRRRSTCCCCAAPGWGATVRFATRCCERPGGETGRFVDVTAAAGLAYPAYPTQTAAWADYDGDGDLDLLVGNESAATSPILAARQGRQAYPSQLFRNDGDGTFTDVARAAGSTTDASPKGSPGATTTTTATPTSTSPTSAPTASTATTATAASPTSPPTCGVTEPARSFATWFFDYDNDGDLDLFVADYVQAPRAVSASYLGHADRDRPAAALPQRRRAVRRRLARPSACARPRRCRWAPTSATSTTTAGSTSTSAPAIPTTTRSCPT